MKFPGRNITSPCARERCDNLSPPWQISRVITFSSDKRATTLPFSVINRERCRAGMDARIDFFLGEKRMDDGEEVVDDVHCMNKHRFIFSSSIKRQRETVLFRDRVTFHSSDLISQECLFFCSR